MKRIWTLRWKLGLGLGFGVVERGLGSEFKARGFLVGDFGVWGSEIFFFKLGFLAWGLCEHLILGEYLEDGIEVNGGDCHGDTGCSQHYGCWL